MARRRRKKKRKKKGPGWRLAAAGLIVAAIGFLLVLVIWGSAWDYITGSSRPRERIAGPVATAILLTGNLNGRLVPCGCEEGELGGVARAASVFRQWREERSDSIVVDIGNATIAGHRARDTVNRFVFEALDALGTSVVNCGVNEVTLPPGRLQKLAKGRSFQLVSANFVHADSGRPVVEPYHFEQRGGLRIAFVGLVHGDFDPVRLDKRYRITDPAKALAKVMADLEDQAELVVVLAFLPPESLYALAKECGKDNTIFLGGRTSVSSGPAEFLRDRIPIAYLGDEGCSVARLDYGSKPGQKPAVHTVTRLLDDRVPQDEALRALAARFTAALGKARPPGADWERKMPCTSQYVGSDVCRICHLREFYKWLPTHHAGAYATLLMKGKHKDRTCLPCHTTGYGLPGGYDPGRPNIVPRRLPGLKPGDMVDRKRRRPRSQHPLLGVGCECCHGGARRHLGQAIKYREDREWVRGPWSHLRPKAALRNCRTCHGAHRPCVPEGKSDEFEMETYLERIDHWSRKKPGAPKKKPGTGPQSSLMAPPAQWRPYARAENLAPTALPPSPSARRPAWVAACRLLLAHAGPRGAWLADQMPPRP